MREYIAIDLKSYYASVECVHRGLDPLKANLLVADESRSDKTIVLAVSPALKAIGVPPRPRLFEARHAIRLAERRLHHRIEYIVAPPRMAEYIRISSLIYGIYLQFVAPEDIHVYSIDECFIDATPYLHLYHPNREQDASSILATRMIHAVLTETGITATAGIGTNLYLAKIAMDIVAKKAPADAFGVRIARLDEYTFKRQLWMHKPITDFWQIARGTAGRLSRFGMYTMGDIASMSLVDEELLYRIFGINAELIIDHAWGIEPCTMADIKAYKPDRHSMNIGQVLPRPYSFDEALLVCLEMADQLSFNMVQDNVISDHFSYWVSFDPKSLDSGLYNGPVHIDYYGRLVPKHVAGNLRLPSATSSCTAIMDAIRTSFIAKVDRHLFIRRLGVAANSIHPDDGYYQLDLFTDHDKLQRENRLQHAMLAIRHRYGSNAVLRGMNFMEGGTQRERNTQIGGHHA